MTSTMIAGFITSFIMAYVLAHVLAYSQAETIVEGLMGGFWMWLGFVATVTLGGVLWERKPLGWWTLTNSYHLVSILLMSIVLVLL